MNSKIEFEKWWDHTPLRHMIDQSMATQIPRKTVMLDALFCGLIIFVVVVAAAFYYHSTD